MSRTIRSPRGTDAHRAGWQTEAPLRMLMNNLDPEVAEHPEELVVYGGIGQGGARLAVVRRARAHAAHADARRDDARPVRPPGRRDAHARVGAARADRQLQPGRRLGELGGVPPARGAGPDDVRPDDGRLVDLHRHPGHPAGHVRDVRRRRRKRFDGHARRHHHPHGRARRHGRRPAAGGDDERRRRDLHRVRPVAHRSAGSSTATSTRAADSLDDALRLAGRRAARRRPLSIGVLGNAADLRARAARAAARRSTSSPTRPRRTTRLRTCRRASTFDDWASCAREGPGRLHRPGPGVDGPALRGDGRVPGRRRRGLRLRQLAARGGPPGGFDRAFDFPGFVPAYIRPLFCEGKGPFRWAALSGDPADIAATDQAVLELFPDNEPLQPLDPQGQEQVAFQGLPARICWLGYGERERAGVRFNDMVASGELSAPLVDRPRPPRLRVGRVAVPRDRGDARRLRRDRRLAAAERDGQRRLRRLVGVDPPRRRRRHGPLDPRRQVCVVDGTALAGAEAERVLTNDPGMGVIRHVDAGYDEAVEVAQSARRPHPHA